MKKFEMPAIEVEVFAIADVITASDQDTEFTPTENDVGWDPL